MYVKKPRLTKRQQKQARLEKLKKAREARHKKEEEETEEEEGEEEPRFLDPGFITLKPAHKIYFQGDFDKNPVTVRITNSTRRRIGWKAKTTHTRRLSVDPAAGVLDPKESVLITVSCVAFAYRGQKDTKVEFITINWVNSPKDAKECDPEWFRAGSIIGLETLDIEYNP